MPNLQDVKLLPLKDDEKFENLCLDLWKRKKPNGNFQRNGRRGQRQNGVDIFGNEEQPNGNLKWIGIQCKVKSMGDNLTKAEIEEEIAKAKTFVPPLSEYIIFTTAPRDATIQQFARQKSDEHRKMGLFPVTIHFWDDIELDLADEENLDICHKYYRDFFIDVQNMQIAISKLVNIEIGIDGKCDTRYEVMIGKIPKGKEDSYFGINYYKGSYYITDLQNKTFDTFPIPCHPSDLESVFRERRDRYIISKWINSVQLDDLIYESEINYCSTITAEEYLDLIKEEF
jgi:hypothetical protein